MYVRVCMHEVGAKTLRGLIVKGSYMISRKNLGPGISGAIRKYFNNSKQVNERRFGRERRLERIREAAWSKPWNWKSGWPA